MINYTCGFVYVLTNDIMPGLVKIGLTTALPEDRAKDLYSTGVPEPFKVAFRAITSWPKKVEQKAHQILRDHRHNHKREFFRVSEDEAIVAVRTARLDVAGIAAWQSRNLHILKNKDRVALTMRAGQFFVKIGYRDNENPLTSRPIPLDIWQAHSDGDLLEIYVTDSPNHISGFSSGDPGCTDDPVPFLNREGTAANEFINGREYLTTGERLLWLPSPMEWSKQSSVIFEASSDCQVVSRTVSIQTGPMGIPLLLNIPTHMPVEPAAVRAIRQALALPVPRTWEPRAPRRGSQAPAPDHWLLQLRRKRP